MSAQPIRLLLVEDNAQDVELFRRALGGGEPSAFTVAHVTRLAGALEHLTQGGVDAVVLDLNLPDGRGLELVERIRGHAPAIPVVVLTGTYEEEALAVEALQKGAQDYLFKDGLDGRGLRRALRYAIERARKEQALLDLNAQLDQQLKRLTWLNQMMLGREEHIRALEEQVHALQEQLAARPGRQGGAHGTS